MWEAAADKTAAIAAEGLGKRFESIAALHDVSFHIMPGEVHGLVGQNGAGKSTLINILSGMITADAGTLHLHGRPAQITSTRQALELGIATVYQELSLLPNLTVAQNFALGRETHRFGLLDKPRMVKEAAAALTLLGLNIDSEARIGRLPLAKRQMVEIAKALAARPSILILDEPTASLGPSESDLLFSAIGRLRAQGVAILYVSHRFSEVLALCDRATILRNGRLVTTSSLQGWTEARLTDAMIGARVERYVRQPRPRGAALLEATDLAWRDRVRGVTLTVHGGEILALTGLLGEGQNETARVIAGDLAPDVGRVTIGTKEIGGQGPGTAIRAGVCLLTEERQVEGILPNRPLRENLAVASLRQRANRLGLVRRQSEQEATTMVAKNFGIVASSLEAPIRTLSGGNQQKAMLARWDLARTQVFVLIEPTSGVDVGARADIYRRLETMAAAGKAIIVVSSDLAEVLTIADRILVFRDGGLNGETTPHAIDEDRLNLMIQGVAAV